MPKQRERESKESDEYEDSSRMARHGSTRTLVSVVEGRKGRVEQAHGACDRTSALDDIASIDHLLDTEALDGAHDASADADRRRNEARDALNLPPVA